MVMFPTITALAPARIAASKGSSAAAFSTGSDGTDAGPSSVL